MSNDTEPKIRAAWDAAQDDAEYGKLWEQFMTPELGAWGRYWSVRLSYGECSTADAGELADIAKENTISETEFLGYGVRVRLSASGYMDATDWEFISSAAELDAWIHREFEASGLWEQD